MENPNESFQVRLEALCLTINITILIKSTGKQDTLSYSVIFECFSSVIFDVRFCCAGLALGTVRGYVTERDRKCFVVQSADKATTTTALTGKGLSYYYPHTFFVYFLFKLSCIL